MHRIKENALFLIDGSYILYRSYYGLRPLYTSSGIPTQATYGFCRTIKRIIDIFDPTKMALVWDSKGKTFRSEMYEEYKATRQAPPSDLFIQKEQIQEFANSIGLYQIAKTGYEADDLIATLAEKNKKGQTIIVGPDKDLFQLIKDKDVMIYDSFKEKLIDETDFRKEKGFGPEKLRFYHSLLGDASDNIPGVKGIGKKTALELVQKFDSLEELYQNMEKIKKEGVQKALIENKKNAFLSYELFGLKLYKLSVGKKDLDFNESHWVNAAPIFQKLEFKSMLADLRKVYSTDVQKILSEGKDLISRKSEHEIEITEKKAKEVQATIAFDNETKNKKDDWTCRVVSKNEDLEKLIDKIKEKKIFAFDTETTGLRAMQDELVALSIAFEKKKKLITFLLLIRMAQKKKMLKFLKLKKRL
ncbi:MAG: 5'-3' exonuclease H3TH domain-containing protein [bacterium]